MNIDSLSSNPVFLIQRPNDKTELLSRTNTPGAHSQDGVLGGRGIQVSSQLGHLPGTGGGPETPKGTGGTPSDRVGHGTWGY